MGEVIYGYDFKAKAEKGNPAPSNYSLDHSTLIQAQADPEMPCDVAYSAPLDDPA